MREILSALLQDHMRTLVFVIRTLSTVHSTITEIVTEAATAEIEASALAVALALVVAGSILRRQRPNLARASALSAGGYLVALITIAVAVRNHGWLTGVDGPVTAWLVDHRTTALDYVAVAVTTVGGPPETAAVTVVIAALIAWRTRTIGPALVLLMTVAGASLVCTVIKLVVGRERPSLTLQLLVETDPSFPSGHTTGTATLMMMTVLVVGAGWQGSRRLLLASAAAVFTVLVAASRLYLGVHWFTDVVAGLLLAALAVTIGSYVLHFLDARAPRAAAPHIPASTSTSTSTSKDVTL